MKSVMRLFNGAVVALSLNLSLADAQPTFEKNGEVKIPRADFKTAEGRVSASFRATRWGMYKLMYEGSADSQPKATLNGQGPI